MLTAGRPAPGGILSKLWRAATDPSYRSVLWYRYLRASAFQPSSQTYENRYPDIFSFVQSRLGRTTPARVLSFGCSTGAEVFWLRWYLPQAQIKGIDLNAGSIAACRARARRKGDRNLSFAVADSTDGEPAEFYDAIFCMAVLRDGRLAEPGVERCDHLLRFEDFARTVEGFARCLRPGGLLVIRHANFRLSDTRVAGAFETILDLPDTTGRSPLFGPDNARVADADYPDTVFRKIA